MPLNNLLAERSLILLEPDFFVAGYVRTALVASGAQVYGQEQDFQQCVTLLNDIVIDAAVLSLDDPAFDTLLFAGLLRDRQIPVMFVSTKAAELGSDEPIGPLLCKPFASFQVIEMVVALLDTKSRTQKHPPNLS